MNFLSTHTIKINIDIDKKFCLCFVSSDYSDISFFFGAMVWIWLGWPSHCVAHVVLVNLVALAQPKDVIVQNWMQMMYLEWQFLRKTFSTLFISIWIFKKQYNSLQTKKILREIFQNISLRILRVLNHAMKLIMRCKPWILPSEMMISASIKPHSASFCGCKKWFSTRKILREIFQNISLRDFVVSKEYTWFLICYIFCICFLWM